MGDLSIKSLFNCETGSSKVIDVRSIVDRKDKTFDVRKILIAKEEKRRKLCDIYEVYYKKCLNKIDVAITKGKNDLLYFIPYRIDDIPDYNSLECLRYIDKRLRAQYMDTHIYNSCIIFITWFYIEANIENEYREENEKDLSIHNNV